MTESTIQERGFGVALAALGMRALGSATPAGRERRAAALAGVLRRAGRRSRHVAAANLAVCFPEQEATQQRALLASHIDFTARLVVDVASGWRGPEDAWRQMIERVCGADPAPGGRPTLLLAPHLGNWELLNLYLGAEHSLTALFDPPRQAALRHLIHAGRQRSGSTLLPIGPGGLRAFTRRLVAGDLVALLPDQVPAPAQGVYADFFTRPALTMTLAQRLALRHDARVLLGWAQRLASGRYQLRFDDVTEQIVVADPVVSAAALNAVIEAQIRQAPEQYQWSYRRFKRPPPGWGTLY